ncbi:hypothetical protein [Microbacterium sp. 2FI]|uniref:hypothetical protein n=1 Tax=Microbacterium sp. 2FI TaxID=2502193 RepID=UPI0010F90C35|nr:hypothetical protein [Microbacterium sp. 2FI]
MLIDGDEDVACWCANYKRSPLEVGERGLHREFCASISELPNTEDRLGKDYCRACGPCMGEAATELPAVHLV